MEKHQESEAVAAEQSISVFSLIMSPIKDQGFESGLIMTLSLVEDNWVQLVPLLL